MTRKRLAKLKRELAERRRSPQKARDLERLAQKLGRKKVKRGAEPMWESTEFSELFVLSIPHHGSRDLAIGTQNSILDQLEEDVVAWDARIDERNGEE
jgi:hypothetical protein